MDAALTTGQIGAERKEIGAWAEKLCQNLLTT